MAFNAKNIHGIAYDIQGWVGSERLSINWIEGTAYRYHVWIKLGDDDFTPEQPTIYKNSMAKHNEPGHFHTRYLDLDAKNNRAMFDHVVNIIKREDLNSKAWAAYRDQQAKEAAEQVERIRLNDHAKEIFKSMRDLITENAHRQDHFKYELTYDDVCALLIYAPKPE